MIIVPFEPEHLNGLQLQAAQVLLQPSFTNPAYGQSLKSGGEAFSAIADGKVVAVAGVVNVWDGRGVAWALFTQQALDNFRPIYKAIKAFFAFCGLRRVEAYVDCSFEKAHRLMQKLGFEIECERMRGFTPDGRDCALYSLVRN